MPSFFHVLRRVLPGLFIPLLLGLFGRAGAVEVTRDFIHRNWSAAEGVRESEILCLAQTPDGYVWFGTRAGLTRFDGLNFTHFTRANTGVLKHDRIGELAVDRDGALWMVCGMNFGYRLSLGVPSRVVASDGASPIYLGGLVASPAGGFWAKISGQSDMLWREGRVETPPFPDLKAGSVILECRNGAIGCAHPVGFSRMAGPGRQRKDWAMERLPDSEHAAVLAEDGEGRIWMRRGHKARGELQLYRMDGEGPVPVGTPGTDNAGRREFLVATHDGSLWWSAANRGLDRFRDGVTTRYEVPWARDFDTALCFLEDFEGNLWFGTEHSGLHCLRPHRIGSIRQDQGLPDVSIRALIPARDGVFAGTEAGLARVAAGPPSESVASNPSQRGSGSGGVFDFKGPTERGSDKPRSVRALATDGLGRTWVGSDRGLSRVDGDRLVPIPLPPPQPDTQDDPLWVSKIRALAFDGRDGLWIAGSEYLTWMPQPAESVRSVGYRLAKPSTISPDRSGGLWIATPYRGVGHLARGRLPEDNLASVPATYRSPAEFLDATGIRWLTPTNGLSSLHAWEVYQDASGVVWIATETGLNRVVWDLSDPGSVPRVQVFTTEHGLVDSQVNGVVEDDFGHFWFGTDQGLCRVSGMDLAAVAEGRAPRFLSTVYLEADGLPSKEISGRLSHPPECRTSDGLLWFATDKGIAVVDPRQLREGDPAARVAIEEVRVDDESVFVTAPGPVPPKPEAIATVATGAATPAPEGVPNSFRVGSLKGVPGEEAPLVLAPGRARLMEFRFAGLHFAAPEACAFRFRLDGYDAPGIWHEAGTRRVAYFTNLDPGNYRFQVLAANHQGRWGETPATFAFRLEPLFRQTWVFRIGMVVLLAGFVWGFVAWRMREVRRREREHRERAVLGERLEIARDLHDIVGAQFTELIQLGEVLGGLPPDKAAPLLPRMTDLAREIFQSVRNSMWATTPEADNLGALVDYLGAAGRRLLSAPGIGFRLDLPEEIPAIPVSPVVRRQLFLAGQEAINNAARHSGASRVVLRLRWDAGFGDGFVIEIEDNGRGMGELASPQPGAILSARREGGGKPRRPGNGLRNIRDRLKAAGGEVEFLTPEGGGTLVRLRVPSSSGGLGRTAGVVER
jgi:signal transduction histidine kinase/ligand-binding sensor domain-containing protein